MSLQITEITFGAEVRLAFDLDHKGVREVFLLAGPRTLSLAAVQLVFFVDAYLASFMPTGNLTALYYAFQLMLLPLGVFSIAISAAVFPAMSRYASLGQSAKMRDALQQAIRGSSSSLTRDRHGRAPPSDREPALPVRRLRR